jgi:DnaK suppressor protein
MNTHQWRGDDRGLRELLESRRRQLTEDLQLRLTRIREHGSGAIRAQEPDCGDPCDLDVRLLEIATATLRHVDRAIARLGEGRYGRCVRCGEPIATARLQAMPFAQRCQACELARERETAAAAFNGRRRLWTEGYVADDGWRRDDS